MVKQIKTTVVKTRTQSGRTKTAPVIPRCFRFNLMIWVGTLEPVEGLCWRPNLIPALLPNKMVTFSQQENNEIKMQLFLKNQNCNVAKCFFKKGCKKIKDKID